MEPLSDDFLLTIAQIAATLIGLLLLGGFFYLETGLSRARAVGDAGEPFLRATVKTSLLLYALVLVVSLGLVALRPGVLAVAFGVTAAVLVKAQVEWTLRYRDLRRVLPVPWESPMLTWTATIAAVAVPWVLGGWVPGREAMGWTLLIAGGLAIVGTAGLLLTTFDLARLERLGAEPTET